MEINMVGDMNADMKIIIGFGSKRLRGKSTSANIMTALLTSRGFKVRPDAFAASLKDVCKTVFSFNDDQLYGDLKEVVDEFWGFTPRWAMQTVGTEAFRENIRDDIWVRCVEKRFLLDPRSVVISDLRFENEARAIKEMGGYIIRCDRDVPHDNNKDQHRSETGLDHFDEWDFVLDNNQSIDHLELQLVDVLNSILFHKTQGEEHA